MYFCVLNRTNENIKKPSEIVRQLSVSAHFVDCPKLIVGTNFELLIAYRIKEDDSTVKTNRDIVLLAKVTGVSMYRDCKGVVYIDLEISNKRFLNKSPISGMSFNSNTKKWKINIRSTLVHIMGVEAGLYV